MARYNKIYAGPFTEATPQVQERICAAAVLPGTALVDSGANFAQAGAASNLRIYIAQDNYLTMKGVDDAWAAGDRVIGMEMLDEQFFNVRVPTATNVARGAALTTNASGKFVLATTGNRIIAFAEEAYNNTSGSDQLVRARVAKGNLASA
ncbi:hypothetical protein FHS21_001329 [Phyllobacterium trifolii]|uniref:Uncharacterized protein n=1 Tax=Phyllobacterium trifolii TaxID=300193 RepID=A0A839U2Q3_9HYPH|nr:hypothetical protein [Phyllobacterium trifolii]MBB3144928.1 hypothetical protein [Phyllobacterium trifolii]